MASTPRRPVSALDAAEALFKPAKKVTVPIIERKAVPEGKEMVSLKLDRAVLEHFQADGPGWQERINDTLRAAVEGKV
ncbi:BrnA antitoxin family protein [Pararhizobium sp.]|uniref:BrnA antitoxin family protein n=1 Tax=Pararhizobium sp. TaxID=1977563 RepID=UPI0027174757|nr:BrnA antitoxin family protein [Pararhizobium sp.]MDO9414815.1 BrnA antitoxin family protein [Pararhizobium sp.]